MGIPFEIGSDVEKELDLTPQKKHPKTLGRYTCSLS